MSWTFAPLNETGELTQPYRAELYRMVRQVHDDTSAQVALHAIEQWSGFIVAVRAFQALKRDPASFLPPRERNRLAGQLFTAQKSPYNLTYMCDPRVQQALPLLIFRDGEREPKLREAMIDLNSP